MLIYLDICCFNRPFDDQAQLRVRLESEAKLSLQESLRSGTHRLAWSYMMDFENAANPYEERRRTIDAWQRLAVVDVDASPEIVASAIRLHERGIKKVDALHLACAIAMNCDVFFTTDDGLLKRRGLFTEVAIMSPVDYAFLHDD